MKKRRKPITFLFLIAVIVLIVSLFYVILSKKDERSEEDFIKTFHKNRNSLERIIEKLTSLDNQYLTIYMDSNEVLAYDNGNPINLSDIPIDDDMARDIKNIYKSMDLNCIYKLSDYVEFVFNNSVDQHSIAYTNDKKSLNRYTKIIDLGDKWYYCYIFNI